MQEMQGAARLSHMGHFIGIINVTVLQWHQKEQQKHLLSFYCATMDYYYVMYLNVLIKCLHQIHP